MLRRGKPLHLDIYLQCTHMYLLPRTHSQQTEKVRWAMPSYGKVRPSPVVGTLGNDELQQLSNQPGRLV